MKALVLPLVVAALSQAPTFRIGIERVQIDVSATRGGRPVAGLTAADFVVTDNGVTQQIESAQLEDAALSVQLVLDTSSSVSGPRLQRLIDASTGLLGSLRSSDRAGLFTFSTSVDVRVPMTGDLERVTRALATVRGAGATSLRDAVQLALESPPAQGSRMLILVFSDGEDTTSWLRAADVVESARRSGVVVHVVEIHGSSGTSSFSLALTDSAGGRVFSASSAEDLARLFTRALGEMRARYLLTFAPGSPTVPGWHDLRVKVRTDGIDVKARPGYFVNPPR
jgi:Ca-activated chloride channel homolog